MRLVHGFTPSIIRILYAGLDIDAVLFEPGGIPVHVIMRLSHARFKYAHVDLRSWFNVQVQWQKITRAVKGISFELKTLEIEPLLAGTTPSHSSH